MALTKIGSIGINTGIKFAGVTTITTLNSATDTLTIGGPVSIAGTLTYEDVTNVDSVGLITARNGIVVGSGITLSKDGDIFATGITTISENLKVGTGVTISPDGDGFFTGVVTATSYAGDGSALTGISVDSTQIVTGNTSVQTVDTGSDGHVKVNTEGSERARIDSSGRLLLGTTTEGEGGADDLTIATSGNTGITIRSGTTGEGNIFFSDGTSGGDEYRGIVRYLHNGNSMQFFTDTTERLRIGNSGEIGIAGANYGSSGQVLSSQGSGSAVQWATVSTDLQFAQWRVTQNWSGNADPIGNWAETSEKNGDFVVNSGIFTFPSTGFWDIMIQCYGYKNDDQDNIELHIMQTTNNSSYTTRSLAYSHMNNDDGGNLYTTLHAESIFDVTDTSQCKVKFKTAGNSVNWEANSGSNTCYAIFKRLGST